MELLERYLQAVKFWLPKNQKTDIIAELSEDLRSQIEEREAALGRKLNSSEVEAFLRECGRPLLVANRYLPQQSLIGPVLFPIYKFVLKMVALCYLLPWVFVWFCLMSFSPSYRAEHGDWVSSALAGWASLWVVALMAFGAVTLVFAILERTKTQSHFLEKWNPRQLPPVRNPNQIKRFSSIIELVANFSLIPWVAYLSSPTIVNRPEIKITLSSAWNYLFWCFILLAICNLALAAVNLMRPYWTILRATIRLALDALGWAVFCWFLKSSVLTDLVVPSLGPEKSLQIRDTANLFMTKAVPVVIMIAAIVAVVNLYRIIRVANQDRHLVPGLPVTVA